MNICMTTEKSMKEYATVYPTLTLLHIVVMKNPIQCIEQPNENRIAYVTIVGERVKN